MGSDGPSTLYYPVGAAFPPGRRPYGPEASRDFNDFNDFPYALCPIPFLISTICKQRPLIESQWPFDANLL
jgi:hypothetical protein